MRLNVIETAPQPSARGLSPIDRAHLARFTFGNTDLELEVLALFAQQAPETLAILEGADTPKTWRYAAHTLKGSARAVGAWEVAAAAESAERQQFTEPEARARTISDLRGALQRAIDYVHGLPRAA
jgi:HPt (histidine-containing phosphotransfer) domain-containing protein